MKTFRSSLVLFVIGLAIFFNIERLDFGEENIIDISSFVYVLGLMVIITTITMPILQRTNLTTLMLMWTGIYGIVKIIIFLDVGRPLFGGIYTYLSITELVLLLTSVWLAHRISITLYEFEDAVEKITFADSDEHIHQLDKSTEEIQIEMFRSRHHHHPLSVIVVEPKPESIQANMHHVVQEVQEAMMSRYILNTMAKTVNKYLRRSDLILEQREPGRFIILCPETTSEESKLIVEYVQTVTAEQLGIDIFCGVATFPHEAITFEELVHQAEVRLHHSNNGNSKPLVAQESAV